MHFPISLEMASESARSGVGGKIVTNRRKQRLVTTPYERPPPPIPAKIPNWFTGIVFPSARALASGAGKILTSILYDSDSSSSEDGDASEGDVDKRHSGLDEPNERSATPSQKRSGSETKQLIEKLIGHEIFSREERDKLIRVLNSRVVDHTVESSEKNVLDGPTSKVLEQDGFDTYEKAVQEAKKWFQNDRLGSTSTSKFPHGTSLSNSSAIQHAEHGGGSNVDIARSYLKGRAAWTLSSGHSEVYTPFTDRTKLFREGTTQSVGHDSFCSSKKWSSLASGSFNIQEELRRVRSKAIELKGGKIMETEPSKEIKLTEGSLDAGMSSVLALAALDPSKDVVQASELLQSNSASQSKVPEDIDGHVDAEEKHTDKIKRDASPINCVPFSNASVDTKMDEKQAGVGSEEAYMDIPVVAESESSQNSLGTPMRSSDRKPMKSGKYTVRKTRKG